LTDDGDPVIYEGLMYQVLEEAKKNNITVSPHCELSPWAERRFEIKEYKLEPFFVKRDIEIAKKTDSPLNISHVSMEKSVNEIALAKKKGIPITCEVTPHHFVLTMEAQKSYGSNAKVNPPLRSKYDVTAIIDAISDGTIDIIASDHAPHGVKSKVWDEAEYGIIGLETTLGLVLTKLVIPNIISLSNAIAKMTINPAQIFNLEGGKLTPGMPADITIIDLEKEWKVDVNKFQSKSKNSPFEGWKLKGISTATIVRGKIVMKGGKIL
jgi:dihydroorotase